MTSSGGGGAACSLGLPAGMLIVLVRRAGDSFIPEGGTVLHSGDELLIVADNAGWREAGALFATPT